MASIKEEEAGSASGVDAAEAAAKVGDAEKMVEALFLGGSFDAIVRTLQRRYERLSPDDVFDCVAEAVAEAYEALSSGKAINNFSGYLFKSASNKAYDRVEDLKNLSDENPDRFGATGGDEGQQRHAIRAELRAQALERARALLPQIGQTNIQRVMEVLLDAVEHEVVDLPPERVAEAVGITPETARRLINRGLQRLRRLAEEAGFNLPTYQVLDHDDEQHFHDGGSDGDDESH
jgi:RNA polymerase sigma factor (sigma-70 family)